MPKRPRDLSCNASRAGKRKSAKPTNTKIVSGLLQVAIHAGLAPSTSTSSPPDDVVAESDNRDDDGLGSGSRSGGRMFFDAQGDGGDGDLEDKEGVSKLY